MVVSNIFFYTRDSLSWHKLDHGPAFDKTLSQGSPFDHLFWNAWNWWPKLQWIVSSRDLMIIKQLLSLQVLSQGKVDHLNGSPPIMSWPDLLRQSAACVLWKCAEVLSSAVLTYPLTVGFIVFFKIKQLFFPLFFNSMQLWSLCTLWS